MNTDVKSIVVKIIEKRNLCSYMNNTKWNELIYAIRTQMPFLPPFDIKYLTEESHIDADIQRKDVFHCGDWNGENFPHQDSLCNIEWVKIRPRYLKYQGRLIQPAVIDATSEFEGILAKYQIPYEEENGLYTIYGYR